MQADVKFLTWKECFDSLPDPRVVGRTQHRLIDILFLTLCGVTVGMDDFEGVVDCPPVSIAHDAVITTRGAGALRYDTGRLPAGLTGWNPA